jgi:ligand-binding sensor domain-containing protein
MVGLFGLFGWLGLLLGDGVAYGKEGGFVIPNPAASIQALTVVNERVIYAGTFGAGIYRSENRGDQWVPANEGLSDPFVLSLVTARDGTVYAGTFRGGVFRKKPSDVGWEPINEGLKRLEIKALVVSNGLLFAGTGDGVYQAPESAPKWSVVTTGLDDTLVHALARSKDGTLYAGTSGKGVLRYRKPTPGWSRMRQGLKDHEGLVENFIRVIVMDKDQELYIGTFDGGVFHSADRGENWRPISRALPNDSIRGIVAADKTLIVATGRGIYKTDNKGRKWVPLNKGLTEQSIQSLVLSQNGTLYAGTNAGVFRSSDEGATWVGVSEGLRVEQEVPFTFQ